MLSDVLQGRYNPHLPHHHHYASENPVMLASHYSARRSLLRKRGKSAGKMRLRSWEFPRALVMEVREKFEMQLYDTFAVNCGIRLG